MLKKLFVFAAIIGLLAISFFGCSSEEYTTAKLDIQQKNWAHAEEFLIKAMVVEPDNPEIPYQLGEQIYAREKKWVEMNEMFEKALALDPNLSILVGPTVREYVNNSRDKYWVNAYNDAVNSYKNMNSAIDSTEREELLRITIDKFKIATIINPTESQTFASIATAYLDLNDLDLALDYILKAVELDPENPKILNITGQLYSRNEDCENAVKYYQLAVKAEPNNSQAIRSLASVYYECDDLEGAIITYESAINKEKDTSIKCDLYFNLGVLYNQSGDLILAEDNFMTVLDLCPDDVEAIVGIAQVFENAEKWSKAERFYKNLIEVDPDNPNHYKGMSRVLLRQGEQEEAQYYYEKSKTVGM